MVFVFYRIIKTCFNIFFSFQNQCITYMLLSLFPGGREKVLYAMIAAGLGIMDSVASHTLVQLCGTHCH